jgi:hypothetical protein
MSDSGFPSNRGMAVMLGAEQLGGAEFIRKVRARWRYRNQRGRLGRRSRSESMAASGPVLSSGGIFLWGIEEGSLCGKKENGALFAK